MLDPYKIETPLDFSVISDHQKEMHGVFVQQFTDPESGDTYALINSLSKNAGNITFTSKTSDQIDFVDVLTGREFGAAIPLDPWTVYLLKVVAK